MALDRHVDPRAWCRPAHRVSARLDVHPTLRADVDRRAPDFGAVPDLHASSASPAQHLPLQERAAPAGHALAGARLDHRSINGQQSLVLLVLFVGYVGGVSIGEVDLPLGARQEGRP